MQYAPRTNAQLLSELEKALAHERELKQRRSHMVKALARSPKKSPKKSLPKPPQERNEVTAAPPAQSSAAILAYRPDSMHDIDQTTQETFPDPVSAASPACSQDTIDAAIEENVATILNKRNGALAREDVASTRIVQIDPLQGIPKSNSSPFFLSSKRRAMHCELDDPGAIVQYPRHRRSPHRGGFLGRLLSCFGGGPPSPTIAYDHNNTPTTKRPQSAGGAPPVLALGGSSMEPLRCSLAGLQPTGVLSAPTEHLPPLFEDTCTAVDVADKKHGLGGALRSSISLTLEGKDAAGGALAEREHSFESLTALLSDEEGDSPFAQRRRTPVAGERGQPVEPQSIKKYQEGQEKGSNVMQPPQQQQQKQQQSLDNHDADVLALQLALLHALKVPKPPTAAAKPVPKQPQANEHAHKSGPHSPVKHTKVSLAELIATHHQQQQQNNAVGGVVPAKKAGSVAAGGYTQKALENKLQFAQKQKHRQAHTAPSSPLKARGNANNDQEQGAAGGGFSAPSSPMKHPDIEPRMTKAAKARSAATQRLLAHRRKQEAARFARLPAAVRANMPQQHDERRQAIVSHAGAAAANQTHQDFRIPPAGSDHHAQSGHYDEPASRKMHAVPPSRISQPRFHDDDDGRQNSPPCKAASSLDSIATVDFEKLQLSPGLARLLNRLTYGMSVDPDKLQQVKHPVFPPVPLHDAQFQAARGVDVQNLAPSGAKGIQSTTRPYTNTSKAKIDPRLVLQPNDLHGNAGILLAALDDGRDVAEDNGQGDDPISPLLTSQKLLSIHDALRQAHETLGLSDEVRLSLAEDCRSADGAALRASSGTLLAQLLEMERSLTVEDLEELRAAIRKEGGVE